MHTSQSDSIRLNKVVENILIRLHHPFKVILREIRVSLLELSHPLVLVFGATKPINIQTCARSLHSLREVILTTSAKLPDEREVDVRKVQELKCSRSLLRFQEQNHQKIMHKLRKVFWYFMMFTSFDLFSIN